MSSNQGPTFSVIMAVYNGAATLLKTLESLRQQTFRDFEIVIVNDASQDDSENIIRCFIKENCEIPVQYLCQENKGLGGARNTAMRAAKGVYLSLLDQDDIWYPDKLEKSADVFKRHPDVSFVAHHLYRRVQGQIKEELSCSSMVENVFHKLLFGDNHFCGSAMSFRRDVLKQIGYFSEDRGRLYMTEDYDYWLRAAARGLKFFVIKEVLGEYVVHGGNFSKNRFLMYRNEWNVVKAHYCQRPFRQWLDPFYLLKRRGKILARQTLSWVRG